MEKMRLNIRFHNPNSEANTRKTISEVIGDVCVKKLKEKLNSTVLPESSTVIEQVHNVSMPV